MMSWWPPWLSLRAIAGARRRLVAAAMEDEQHWLDGVASRVLLRRVAVAQSIACLDLLYICDKVTILGATISVGEGPPGPPEPLSQGQRTRPL
jgi:hypothetical protein